MKKGSSDLFCKIFFCFIFLSFDFLHSFLLFYSFN